MNFNLTISADSLRQMEAAFAQRLDRTRDTVQAAMADAYKGIVDANFGSGGFSRPWPWAPLSPEYARRVGRRFATLYVTGALKGTVQKEAPAGGAPAEVSMSNTGLVPYAMAHHFGNPAGTRQRPGLPARRVFPMNEDGSPTQIAASTVAQAARRAIKEVLP